MTASADGKTDIIVSKKLIGLAVFLELFVVVASLTGAWLFAEKYSDGDQGTKIMMMLAPIGYAVVELSRVPLAYAARVQTSWILRLIAIIAVIAAAGVTVKSMSQLGEIMFRPRLHDVQIAATELQGAKDQLDQKQKERERATENIVLAQQAYEAANERVKSATDALKDSKPICSPTSGVTRDGRPYRGQTCAPDKALPMKQKEAEVAAAALIVARDDLNKAKATRDAIDLDSYKNRIQSLDKTFRRAVMDSQLHSFTAMAYGKDPLLVTDGEVSAFLRIFVFVPAILVSIVATLLALTAVTRVKREPPIYIPDEAGAFLLGPYTEKLVSATASAVQKDVDEAVARALKAAERKAAPPVVEETKPEPVVAPAPAETVEAPVAPAAVQTVKPVEEKPPVVEEKVEEKAEEKDEGIDRMEAPIAYSIVEPVEEAKAEEAKTEEPTEDKAEPDYPMPPPLPKRFQAEADDATPAKPLLTVVKK